MEIKENCISIPAGYGINLDVELEIGRYYLCLNIGKGMYDL